MDALPAISALPAKLTPRIVQAQPARKWWPAPVMYQHLQHPTTPKDRADRALFEEEQRRVTDEKMYELIRLMHASATRPRNRSELRSLLSNFSAGISTM
jgi:hypothetical protein